VRSEPQNGSASSDLALTGFGEFELGDLLADRTQGLTDPDDVPEAPEHPVSRTGDLWLLGQHSSAATALSRSTSSARSAASSRT
jgi:hypothetical protein